MDIARAYVHMKGMMTESEAEPAGKMRATFIIQRCDLQCLPNGKISSSACTHW